MTSPDRVPVSQIPVAGSFAFDDSDERTVSGVSSLLLLIATGAYYGSVWIVSGLAPLALLASHVRGYRGTDRIDSEVAGSRGRPGRSDASV